MVLTNLTNLTRAANTQVNTHIVTGCHPTSTRPVPDHFSGKTRPRSMGEGKEHLSFGHCERATTRLAPTRWLPVGCARRLMRCASLQASKPGIEGQELATQAG